MKKGDKRTTTKWLSSSGKECKRVVTIKECYPRYGFAHCKYGNEVQRIDMEFLKEQKKWEVGTGI